MFEVSFKIPCAFFDITFIFGICAYAGEAKKLFKLVNEPGPIGIYVFENVVRKVN
jgi:hypothetical protein